MNEEEFEECVSYTERTVRGALDKFLESCGEAIPPKNVHLLKGDAEVVIPRFVQKERSDLVVMGTVARSGVAGLVMGNTAETILRHIGCSVLAIKPAGFVSQISVEE